MPANCVGSKTTARMHTQTHTRMQSVWGQLMPSAGLCLVPRWDQASRVFMARCGSCNAASPTCCCCWAHELIMRQCSDTSTCCSNKNKWSSDRYPCKIDGCTGSRLGTAAQRKLTTDVVDNQTGNAGDFWTRCKSPRKKHARGQLRTVWLWGASWLGRRGRERRVTAVGGWRGATLMESPQLTTVRRRAQWERERSGNRPNIKFPSIFLRAVKVEQNQKETPKRAPGKVEKAQG